MNPIEQMMECYGVEKRFAYFECHRGISNIGCPLTYEEKDDGCRGCINSNKMKRIEAYPPFTAEKQIELIKLLAMIDTFAMRYWQGIFVCKVNGIYSSLSKKEGEADFANALAELITSLKNELDHKRVKEILKK